MSQPNENQEQFNRYDRDLTPSEVAAREEREANNFQEFPEDQGDMDTSDGYTVDREGKLNNFAIEPEMYIEEPGDLREQAAAERRQREAELKEINQPGGKGPGLV